MTALFWERPTDQIVLSDVAGRAGVTVQTVLRRFGSKEGLLAAAANRANDLIAAQREAPPDDLPRALDVLLEHYETVGRGVLRLLAAEEGSAWLAGLAERGRELHRDWCRTVFASFLEPLGGADRDRRFAQVVAICDVYTWKLLRHDSGLSRRQTHRALLELLEPLRPTEGTP